MKKITFLGAGAWGQALANMLAKEGYQVVSWTIEENVIASVKEKRIHPRYPKTKVSDNLSIIGDIDEALDGAELIIESVTTAGLRPVLKQYGDKIKRGIPFVLTSKGIEQNTGLLLHEITCEMLGDDFKPFVGCLSGPSLAAEVADEMPASVVCAAYEEDVMMTIQKVFNNAYFRVYPNRDISGVELGGALKNYIAIACGISDGLGFGANTKAALMTRGLHEMRKLGVAKGCNAETLNGLSGLGDLCTTCLSVLSRNYRFGSLLAEGRSPEEAKKEIGMVVEGANTCVSAKQLGDKLGVDLPISQAVYAMVYEGYDPKEMVKKLLSREVKEEHL